MTRPQRKTDYLGEHRPYLGDTDPLLLGNIEKGQVIRFVYHGELRWVFVADANWKNKLHGLDLKHIPRRAFLQVVNAPLELNPRELYDKKIRKTPIPQYESYRTYNRIEMSAIHSVIYNSTLQPAEHDEQGIEEPEQVKDTDELLKGL